MGSASTSRTKSKRAATRRKAPQTLRDPAAPFGRELAARQAYAAELGPFSDDARIWARLDAATDPCERARAMAEILTAISKHWATLRDVERKDYAARIDRAAGELQRVRTKANSREADAADRLEAMIRMWAAEPRPPNALQIAAVLHDVGASQGDERAHALVREAVAAASHTRRGRPAGGRLQGRPLHAILTDLQRHLGLTSRSPSTNAKK